MATPIIEANNISKLYSLGKVGTGSFRQDLKWWWTTQILQQENPFFKIAEGKNRSADYIWALRDVSFDVKEGEVFGIVGKNGAGKSTLLKILSKVISPSKGTIRGRGRINSLLEIGTGFHDELSGRENIYLNGHFLGMHRAEIRQKFDEIVEFSGVADFIDTPVKRYSSGMYVRLAFAVAAHLEPDILIVDEVLAVGDAEFQKKCMGKMQDVSSKQGRTILFVSHNMQAVMNLCNRVMLLEKGAMTDIGAADKVINNYLGSLQQHRLEQQWNDINTAPGNSTVKVKSIELIPHLENANNPIDVRTPLTVKFQFWNQVNNLNLCTGLHLFNQSGECIFDVCTEPANIQAGLMEGVCEVPGNFLNDGSYYFSLIFVKDTSVELFYLEECLSFEVEDYRDNMNWYGKWVGYVRPKFPFAIKPVNKLI